MQLSGESLSGESLRQLFYLSPDSSNKVPELI
jgi:hypothetical protein